MELRLKKICLAISLPLFAFLSLYWLKQRKKNEINDKIELSSSIQNEESIDELDKSNESTVEQQSINNTIDEDKLIKTTVNLIETANNLISNDLSIKDDLKIELSASNLSAANLTSEINLNNNNNDFKLNDQSNNDSRNDAANEISNESNDSTNEIANKSNNLDITNDHLQSSLNNLSNNDKSLIESVKEIFENEKNEENEEQTNQINSTENSSKLNEDDSMQFTENADSLTFNTACDSSINATINSSIKDLTLNSSNYSTRTLRSFIDNKEEEFNYTNDLRLNDAKLDASYEIDELIKSSENAANEVVNREADKVKEDYLNESKILQQQNNTILSNASLDNLSVMNSTAAEVRVVEKKDDDDVNFKNSDLLNNDNLLNAKETSEIDDIVETDEKYLNVTEVEFKNDGKLEAINQVVEELKAKISDEHDKLANDKTDEVINLEEAVNVTKSLEVEPTTTKNNYSIKSECKGDANSIKENNDCFNKSSVSINNNCLNQLIN